MLSRCPASRPKVFGTFYHDLETATRPGWAERGVPSRFTQDAEQGKVLHLAMGDGLFLRNISSLLRTGPSTNYSIRIASTWPYKTRRCFVCIVMRTKYKNNVERVRLSLCTNNYNNNSNKNLHNVLFVLLYVTKNVL